MQLQERFIFEEREQVSIKSGIHCLPGLFVYKTRDKEVGGYKALHKARQGKLKPELERVAGFWSPEFVLD